MFFDTIDFSKFFCRLQNDCLIWKMNLLQRQFSFVLFFILSRPRPRLSSPFPRYRCWFCAIDAHSYLFIKTIKVYIICFRKRCWLVTDFWLCCQEKNDLQTWVNYCVVSVKIDWFGCVLVNSKLIWLVVLGVICHILTK